MISKKYLESFALFFYGATGIFLFVFLQSLSSNELYPICLAGTFLVLFSFAYLHWTRERKIWAVSGVYLFVFAVFHCGLVVVAGLQLEISPEFVIYLNRWMYSGDTKTAIILVMMGICFYELGVTLSGFSSPPRSIENRGGRDAIPVIGFFMVAVSFAGWVSMVILQGGIQTFGGSYSDYRESMQGPLQGWFYFFLGLGLIFLAVSRPGKWRRSGIGIFLLFSVLAMALGLRGEVLFPTFTALAVSGMKKYPLSLPKAVLLGVALLATIAVVRQMRQVGFIEYRFSLASLAPADALAEMGASIRPVVEVVSWIRTGDALMKGSSYLAPVDRALVYVVPGWSRPPFAEDDRLLGPIIGTRAGAIGFSAVAEAFINFGRWGVAFYMLFVGLLLGRLDRWPADPFRQLTAGVILLPFMMQIRNTFVFVPATLAVGLVLVYLIFLVTRFSATERSRRLAADGTAIRS